MGDIKESIKLIDYLKEKGISHDQIKTMIEESIKTTLEKEEKKEEPQGSDKDSDEEEVPSYTVADIKELVDDSVKEALKIKRKVPSKGKIVDKDKPEDKPATSREIAAKDWFEVIV